MLDMCNLCFSFLFFAALPRCIFVRAPSFFSISLISLPAAAVVVKRLRVEHARFSYGRPCRRSSAGGARARGLQRFRAGQ